MCVKTKLIAAGVVAAVAFVGYSIYSGSQMKNQMAQTNNTLTELTKVMAVAVQNQNNQPSSGISEEELAAAFRASLEQHEAAQVQAVLAEKQAKYQLAPESVSKDVRLYGTENARFTLTVFSDMECPYCKRFHPTPKTVVDQSEGNVNWVFKHLPLSFHNPAAEMEAIAAECVNEIKGNRTFWAFVDDIFAKSGGGGQGVSNIMDLASSYGISKSEFSECMNDDSKRVAVNNNVTEAQRLGITGTPATIVTDNHTGQSVVMSGAQPAESFLATIRKLASSNNE